MLIIFIFIEVAKHLLLAKMQFNEEMMQNNNPTSFLTSLLLLNSVKLFDINDITWNAPSWSISAEMISYCFYAIVLMLIVYISEKLTTQFRGKLTT